MHAGTTGGLQVDFFLLGGLFTEAFHLFLDKETSQQSVVRLPREGSKLDHTALAAVALFSTDGFPFGSILYASS